MEVFTIFSLKGGAGKTTTTTFLARWLAAHGKRVLVVDSDIQKAATSYFLADQDDPEGRSIAQAIMQNDLLANAVPAVATSVFRGVDLFTDNIFIVPASFDLLKLTSTPENLIRRLVVSASHSDAFDVVLIDCPAGWNNITVGSIMSADRVVVPVLRHRWDIRATQYFMTLALEYHDVPLEKYVAFLNNSPDVMNADEGSEAGDWRGYVAKGLGAAWSGLQVTRGVGIANSTNFYESITNAKARARIMDEYNALFTRVTGLPPVTDRF